MTKEQAKLLLPIITAFAEGKTIEVMNTSGHWDEINIPNFDVDPKKYRIKPKPKYRPFKDAEECWAEMLKHQPFGWIKSKDDSTTNIFIPIAGVENEDITVANGISFTYDDFLECYVFADDTPCGAKEDQL